MGKPTEKQRYVTPELKNKPLQDLFFKHTLYFAPKWRGMYPSHTNKSKIACNPVKIDKFIKKFEEILHFPPLWGVLFLGKINEIYTSLGGKSAIPCGIASETPPILAA